MNDTERYQRCLVLPGGGFRFGYYLGMHAAAEDSGRRPDVLLASCGGAIAAAVIAGLPDAYARLDWLLSPNMYRFFREITPTNRATPLRIVAAAAMRWLNRAPASRLADLSCDYLFELPAAPPLPTTVPAAAPALAIVGGKVLYGADEIGTTRGNRQLFAQVIFCSARAAALLDGVVAPAADPRWSSGAIVAALQRDSSMPVAEAVRISTADIVYFRNHDHAGQCYTGGLIDLFPIELAHRLAREVIMERKTPFNPWLALPALRAVLGIDGAARLRHVHVQHADVWIDTRDVSTALRAHGIQQDDLLAA